MLRLPRGLASLGQLRLPADNLTDQRLWSLHFEVPESLFPEELRSQLGAVQPRIQFWFRLNNGPVA